MSPSLARDKTTEFFSFKKSEQKPRRINGLTVKKSMSPNLVPSACAGRYCFQLCLSVCISVCMSVQAITYEALHIETSFWYTDTSLPYLGQS